MKRCLRVTRASFWSVLALVFIASTPGFCAEEGIMPARGVITVRANRVTGDVNPLVLGHNIEAANPKGIFGSRSDTMPGRTGNGFWDADMRRPVPVMIEFARQVGITMLRYPGGCLTHNFDWKDAVGPVSERPDFAFGIDEFMSVCRILQAKPMITLSAFKVGANEAAELVDYLNGPAIKGRPWAERRGNWGHPGRYDVEYFEMGNEVDHGNHDIKPFRKHTAKEYGAWVRACSVAMKHVDSRIKIGAHMGTGTGPLDPWNREVLKIAGAYIDYVIIHTYAVGLMGESGRHSSDLVMRACMAAGEQAEAELAAYRKLIAEVTGRDLPMAVTEYNAMFVQDDPVPYRFSLGAALFSADYVRMLFEPRNRILTANYWQFANGYWGMIRGPRDVERERAEWKRMPAYYMYRLWSRHFGDKLVAVSVKGPRLEFEGCLGVRASTAERIARGKSPKVELRAGSSPGVKWELKGLNGAVMRINELNGDVYPMLGEVKVTSGRTYRLSFDGRIDGSVPREVKIGLGLMDGRGWDETKSGNAVEGIEDAGSWKTFSGDLTVLPDCEKLLVVWRVSGVKAPTSARVEVRNLKVIPVRPFPPYSALTCAASLSGNGDTLYVVVFNKHHAREIPTRIRVRGAKLDSGRVWTVTGPSLDSTNVDGEIVRETVSGVRLKRVSAGGFDYTLPPRSMNAFELLVRGKAK